MPHKACVTHDGSASIVETHATTKGRVIVFMNSCQLQRKLVTKCNYISALLRHPEADTNFDSTMCRASCVYLQGHSGSKPRPSATKLL